MKNSKKNYIRWVQAFLKRISPRFLYPFFLLLRTFKNFKKKTIIKKQYIKFSNNLNKINENEFKITSQNNEDGIIDYIFRTIPNNKYFVEIGFGYYEFNSLNLIKNNWQGKLIDFNIEEYLALKTNIGFYYPKSKIKLINSKVDIDNINDLVFFNDINKEIDFFSIDIDGNDYWVLNSMKLFNIKIICCEYNHWLGSEKKISMKYDPNFNFVDNGIFGASLLAYTEMLSKKGFTLIAVESSGTNAFFVNNNYLKYFEKIYPKKSFISIGRFYNDKRKEYIFENIKKSQLFIEV